VLNTIRNICGMMRNNTALSGLFYSTDTVSQGSASLHPGLRVLRPSGTKIRGASVSQGSASLHPGLRVLRPSGTLGTQPRSGVVPAAQGAAKRNPGLSYPNKFFKPWKGEVNYVPQIVSVKGGGNVGVAMVKDLIATVEREKAAMGLFVTLAPPTRPMKEEAVSTGFYNQDKWATEYPKLQILTIEGLMSGAERPRFPDPFGKLRASLTMGRSTFKRAAAEDMGAEQGRLL
jgi:hypothetical protein